MELAHRFIGSQSRISSDRLRKGKVSSKDWPKVVKACNVLESAPLWIDDSSDLGLLELRAKARRLHAQERGRGHEGLEMVIVDYLQLMRTDDPRANRVEQVAQFSRGLKILARELAVPVIGVALSRAPNSARTNAANPLRPEGKRKHRAGRGRGRLPLPRRLLQRRVRGPGWRRADHRQAQERTGRDGPLVFLEHYPKFADRAREDRPVEQSAGEGPPMVDLAEEG